MERVVIVPGLLGSALRNTRVSPSWRARLSRIDTSVVWGGAGMAAWAAAPEAWREALLSGNGIDDAGDVAPAGLLRLPGSDPYGALLADVQARALDVLVFDYDWRLSSHVNARKLRAAIVARWFGDEVTPDPDARVSVLAHSMGGMITRMMVEGADGYRWVKRVVMAGTPHQGSPTAYTHFHNITSSLVRKLNLDNLKWALGMVAPGLAQRMPRRVYVPVVMPRALQNAIAQRAAGGLQLMPRFPFVVRGGSYEPLADTLGGMQQAGTGRSVREIVDLLLCGLRDEQRLNTWLDSVDLDYVTIAGSAMTTLQAYDADHGRLIRTNGGDGVVPLRSAHLPAGKRIRQVTFDGILHQALWEDRRVIRAAFA